jgi:hypothetical protein
VIYHTHGDEPQDIEIHSQACTVANGEISESLVITGHPPSGNWLGRVILEEDAGFGYAEAASVDITISHPGP